MNATEVQSLNIRPNWKIKNIFSQKLQT